MSAPRHTEGATEVEREAFLLEGVSVINALITVADCRLDRNQEFYDAEQWKARALSAITPESAPNDATDERTHLRAQQAATVMPQIGPLLDAWEGIDNDTKGTIREEAPELAKWLGSINRAMEGDAALTQPTTVQQAPLIEQLGEALEFYVGQAHTAKGAAAMEAFRQWQDLKTAPTAVPGDAG